MGIAYRGTNSRYFEIVDQTTVLKPKICSKCGKRFYLEGFPSLRTEKDKYVCSECRNKGENDGYSM